MSSICGAHSAVSPFAVTNLTGEFIVIQYVVWVIPFNRQTGCKKHQNIPQLDSTPFFSATPSPAASDKKKMMLWCMATAGFLYLHVWSLFVQALHKFSTDLQQLSVVFVSKGLTPGNLCLWFLDIYITPNDCAFCASAACRHSSFSFQCSIFHVVFWCRLSFQKNVWARLPPQICYSSITAKLSELLPISFQSFLLIILHMSQNNKWLSSHTARDATKALKTFSLNPNDCANT